MGRQASKHVLSVISGLLAVLIVARLLQDPTFLDVSDLYKRGDDDVDDDVIDNIDPAWDDARFSKLYRDLYHMEGVDCEGLMEGEEGSVAEATRLLLERQELKGFKYSPQDYMSATESCDDFINRFGYINSSLSQTERDFPLAYSMMVFKDIEPVERLLRAIYRPQNFYCIHVDSKADDTFFQAVSAISACFTNVYIEPRREDVKWSEFSVLQPELWCMESLLAKSQAWRYFINLTGQEFPLKTNRELVEILTAYRGANDVEGVRRKANKGRWHYHKDTMPKGIEPSKGAVHVALNRDFVDFAVYDSRSHDLLKWLKPQNVPDETFFSTINHNPSLGVPGSFLGLDDIEAIMERKPWFGRYKSWCDGPCAKRRVHDVCILTIGDLPDIHKSHKFFANKFYLNEDRIVYGCLEQRLFKTTRSLHLGLSHVDTSVYKESVTVRQRMTKQDWGLYWQPKTRFSPMKEREKTYMRPISSLEM